MFRLKLKELREQQKLSQYALAKKLNVAQSTVGGWESGVREPGHETTSKIADFFGVTIDFLLGDDVQYKATQPESSLEEKGLKRGIKIPVLGRVTAGFPAYACEEILDYEEITQEMAATGEFFALQIRGDSMEPRFIEGDVVIIKSQPDVENGEIAIILVNGDDATIKKVSKHRDGISLIPFNPVYSPIFYSKQEISELPVQILGKVVELRGKV